MKRNLLRPRSLVVAAAVLIAGSGCGLTETDATSGEGSGSGADAAWPRTVEVCGEEVVLEAQPERIVGIEGAAETVMALGAGDQLAGWFGNDVNKLPDDLAAEAAKAEYLGGSFPPPNLEAVIAPDPDLVVLYGFNEGAGLTKEAFDDLGVPVLAVSEACPGGDATVEGYFDDVLTFAHAIGADEAGEALIAGWRERIAAATAEPVDGEVSLYIHGNPSPDAPFASGGGSLANDQILIAGGVNAFGDTDEAFLEPSWEEIATRDPDVIVEGSGGMEASTEALRTYLRDDDALSQMTAVQNDAFLTIEYYDNVPGPRVVDGIVKIAEYLRQ